MSSEVSPELEKAFRLSYVHSKLAIKNLEVVVHELEVMDSPIKGRVKHRFNNLVAVHRKAMSAIENNVDDIEVLETDLDAQVDEAWGIL